MATVLPGGSAVLPVNAFGLGTATVPCRARLHDGAASPVTWTGTVAPATDPPPLTVHTGDGAYSTVPRNPVPLWAVVLMVLGALILAALLAVLVRQRRLSRLA
jgi:hypothetical protein